MLICVQIIGFSRDPILWPNGYYGYYHPSKQINSTPYNIIDINIIGSYLEN